jgi:RNA polymerase sigma-32 factor
MARSEQARPAGYLSLVRQAPKLSREREHELAVRWCRLGDNSARDLLIRGQLRHVVAVARRYPRHGSATLEELIAEGNFGLVHALARFDPERGTRFATYAVFWIRAYILQYLVRSKSLVSTGVRSKSFSRIRRVRDEVCAQGTGDSDEQIAARLKLSPERLRALTVRLNVSDVAWDAILEGVAGGLSGLPETDGLSPEDRVLDAETSMHRSQAVSQVVSQLDERERYIVEQRLMAHEEEALSLAEIGRHFRISRERARQLETRAVRKLKAALLGSSIGADFRVCRRAA